MQWIVLVPKLVRKLPLLPFYGKCHTVPFLGVCFLSSLPGVCSCLNRGYSLSQRQSGPGPCCRLCWLRRAFWILEEEGTQGCFENTGNPKLA